MQLKDDDAHAAIILSGIRKCVALEPFAGPVFDDRGALFIAMTPRSGSSYLSSLISANGYFIEGEIFNITPARLQTYVRSRGLATYEDYIRAKVESATRNGLFAAKVNWYHFSPILYAGAFAHYFRSAHFVYLTRENILDQAISLFVGQQTGYFHATHGDRKVNIDDIAFDFEAINFRVEQLIAIQSSWERFFAGHGIAPLRLTYEQLAADPPATLRRIGDYIGRPFDQTLITDTAYKKVGTDKYAALRALFLAESERRQLAKGPKP